MADDTARDHFRWLKQVAADPDLKPATFKLAFHIGEHFNSETGRAFPGVPRLAELMRTDIRTVRRLTDQLVRRGHLSVGYRKGPNHTNIYERVTQDKTALSVCAHSGQKCTEQKPLGTNSTLTGDISDTHSGQPAPLNYLEQLQNLKSKKDRLDWFRKNQPAFTCHVTSDSPTWRRWCDYLGYSPPVDRRFGWSFPAFEPPNEIETTA